MNPCQSGVKNSQPHSKAAPSLLREAGRLRSGGSGIPCTMAMVFGIQLAAGQRPSLFQPGAAPGLTKRRNEGCRPVHRAIHRIARAFSPIWHTESTWGDAQAGIGWAFAQDFQCRHDWHDGCSVRVQRAIFMKWRFARWERIVHGMPITLRHHCAGMLMGD